MKTGLMIFGSTPVAHPSRRSMSVSRIGLMLVLLLMLCSLPLAASQPLILGVHPYLQAQEIQRRFSPLADYLAEGLGEQVMVRVGPSYAAHLDAFSQRHIDVAYMGPSLYVRLQQKGVESALLARLEAKGSPTFRGHIVVAESSEVADLADLSGKVFAFGDPNSTMSSLVPKAMLKQAGVGLSDLAAFQHYKGHSNVAMSVLVGDSDAGAFKEEVYQKFRKRGLRSLVATPEISEHVFVARADLPADKLERLRSLLLAIRSQADVKALLVPIKKSATGLVSASPDDYANLRELMEGLE